MCAVPSRSVTESRGGGGGGGGGGECAVRFRPDTKSCGRGGGGGGVCFPKWDGPFAKIILHATFSKYVCTSFIITILVI